MTNTIIIGDGLTNDILSPQHQFQGVKGHVGQREIERLFGKGRCCVDPLIAGERLKFPR